MSREKVSSKFARLFSFLVILLLGSCVTSPEKEPYKTSPKFSTISVISLDDVIKIGVKESNPPGTADIEDIIEGGAVGGAAGAATGAFLASAYCGPYFYAVCLGVYTLGGIGAGAAYKIDWNIFDQGIKTWKINLSEEDALKLTQVVSKFDRHVNLNSNLTEALRNEIPVDMQRHPSDADVQAMPTVEKINFIKTYDDLVRLQIATSLTFDNGLHGKLTARGKREFLATSESRSVEDWLGNDGFLIEKAVEFCLRRNAEKMARLIVQKAKS